MSATVGRGELKYTPSHLWVRVEDGEAVIGLTGFGQERHGKVNYIGLPAVGAPVTYGMPFAYLQSRAGYGWCSSSRRCRARSRLSTRLSGPARRWSTSILKPMAGWCASPSATRSSSMNWRTRPGTSG